MNILDDVYFWTDHVLSWGLFALWIWAFADCATRKAEAFPAVGKLTKPAWLGILAGAVLLGFLTVQPFAAVTSPAGIISLVATIAAGVYLADVRPAVREITGGR